MGTYTPLYKRGYLSLFGRRGSVRVEVENKEGIQTFHHIRAIAAADHDRELHLIPDDKNQPPITVRGFLTFEGRKESHG